MWVINFAESNFEINENIRGFLSKFDGIETFMNLEGIDLCRRSSVVETKKDTAQSARNVDIRINQTFHSGTTSK